MNKWRFGCRIQQTICASFVVCVSWAASAEPFGFVDFHSEPQGLNVVVNGEPAGKTPITVKLSYGAHKVRSGTKGFGYHEQQLHIDGPRKKVVFKLVESEVRPATTQMTITIPRAVGAVVVASDRPGLPVLLNGEAPQRENRTTLLLENVPTGEHEIRIGGRPAKIRVEQDRLTYVELKDREVVFRVSEEVYRSKMPVSTTPVKDADRVVDKRRDR